MKSDIIKKLEAIAAELEQLESECKQMTGYCNTAVEIALLAVNHANDLVRLAEEYKGRYK
jgi:cell division protein ZapA (FtsZ GTPase activity inhibitor)